MFRVTEHMLGNAVHNWAHFHLDPGRRNIALEYRRAVWFGEDGFGHVLSNFAGIHVKRSYNTNVLRTDATDFPVHQAADIGGRAIPIIVQALYERTCTIAETDDGDFDHVFLSFHTECRTGWFGQTQ